MSAIASAERIAERLDALAAALRQAGVPPERSTRLLGAAAEATMHAVTLDLLADEREVTPERLPEPLREPQVASPVTLAA